MVIISHNTELNFSEFHWDMFKVLKRRGSLRKSQVQVLMSCGNHKIFLNEINYIINICMFSEYMYYHYIILYQASGIHSIISYMSSHLKEFTSFYVAQ